MRTYVSGESFRGEFFAIGQAGEPFDRIRTLVRTAEHVVEIGETVPVHDRSDFRNSRAASLEVDAGTLPVQSRRVGDHAGVVSARWPPADSPLVTIREMSTL
jgi:hypothetical protein